MTCILQKRLLIVIEATQIRSTIPQKKKCIFSIGHRYSTTGMKNDQQGFKRQIKIQNITWVFTYGKQLDNESFHTIKIAGIAACNTLQHSDAGLKRGQLIGC
jgi:hypothetical protein